jgi:trigger factor
MLALKVHNARAAFESDLIEELVADLDFDLPGDLVDAELEARVRNLGQRLEEDSIDFGDYLRITGQDEESFLAEVRSQAVTALSTRVLVEAVISIEGLEAEEADYREAIEAMAASAQTDPDELEKALTTTGQKESLTGDILRRKAIDRLVEAAEPIDADGDPVDLTPIEVEDTEEDPEADDGEAVEEDLPTADGAETESE